MKGQFEKYVNLIRSISWKISKKYHIDYEDVEAQGFLIYCMILENYDVSKSSFSTYLYIQLNGRLKDYAENQKKITNNESGEVYCLDEENELDPELLSVESKDYDLRNDFFEKAKENLDSESYNVFEYITSFEWLRTGRVKPTVTDIMREFNVSKNKANVLWNNCRDFWVNVA